MKKDEMDRDIFLHAEERGYQILVVMLCGWVLFNVFSALAYGDPYNPVPMLILCAGTCGQNFSVLAIRRKMISGDDEYHELNTWIQMGLQTIVLVVLVIAIGVYLTIGH